MQDDQDKYSIWLKEVSHIPDILNLTRKIAEYEEEYFSDLTLNNFVELCDYDDQTDTLSLFGYPQWTVYIIPDEDPDLDGYSAGLCNYDKETGDYRITISESHKNEITTILHEMIHAYAFVIEDSNPIAGQLLSIHLYDKLYSKIPNLKDILYLIGNRDLRELTFNSSHGTTLFLLKSFDLDLRLGLPLGSVLAYGKSERIQGLIEQIKTTGETKIKLVWERMPG
ncbi:MAG: hypothetical protein NTW33_10315 [Methanoregula sp.]|nr:hypothetical protein [Methanoregula sp.]